MKKTKGTEFEFKKDFYNLDSIKDAIKDFKEVAEIQLINDDKIIKINISSKDKKFSDEKLCLEFRNYVFGLMKNKTLV